MVSGGLCVWILCRSGRLLTAKPSLFPALRRVFSKFRRLYRERGKAVFIPCRHCVRRRFFLFAVRIGRCLRGFWRQIKEAPGISRFFGDVREGYGFQLNDGAGETVF